MKLGLVWPAREFSESVVRLPPMLDAIGRQRAVTNPLGKAVSTSYDDANRVRATIDPLGSRTTFGYNVADERVTVKDAMGNVNTSVYDWAGAEAKRMASRRLHEKTDDLPRYERDFSVLV